MGSTSLSPADAAVVRAFQTALAQQLLVVVALLVAIGFGWGALRSAQLKRAIGEGEPVGGPVREATGRQIVRVGFGLLWLLDGILQVQSAMPVGLATRVIGPTADSSPGWVQRIVHSGVVIWTHHPVTAAVSSVWIQVGIGIWLLVATRGRWSRVGGLVAMGWGIVVWVFGEAFGEVLAPGLTIVFGAPGSALLYAFAGAVVALPDRWWTTLNLGRAGLRLLGTFFCAMALLQAWPGRGFWQGSIGGRQPGTLVGMVEEMAATPQPGFLASWVRSFASFDMAHGFVVNLVVVVTVAVLGIAFTTANPRFVRPALYGCVLLFAADWVLVEDLGFFGGLGTDPNSAIPIVLLVVAAAVAMDRPSVAVVPSAPSTLPWRAWAEAHPTAALRILGAAGAAVITALGAIPLLIAAVDPHVDRYPIHAVGGRPPVVVIAPGRGATPSVPVEARGSVVGDFGRE